MQQFPQLLFWSSADSTMLLSPSYLQQQAALADSFTRACCAPGLCWCRDVIWFRCLLAHTPALFPLNLASLPVARQNSIQTWSILNCVCVLHHLWWWDFLYHISQYHLSGIFSPSTVLPVVSSGHLLLKSKPITSQNILCTCSFFQRRYIACFSLEAVGMFLI